MGRNEVLELRCRASSRLAASDGTKAVVWKLRSSLALRTGVQHQHQRGTRRRMLLVMKVKQLMAGDPGILKGGVLVGREHIKWCPPRHMLSEGSYIWRSNGRD